MLRKPWFWLLTVIAVIAFVVVFFRPSETDEAANIPISTLISDVRAGRVASIEIRGDELTVYLNDSSRYQSAKEEDVSLFAIFADQGVDASGVTIDVKEPSKLASWVGLLLNFLPILIFIGLISYFVRQAKK
jgi:ATP-dependent Zn protease